MGWTQEPHVSQGMQILSQSHLEKKLSCIPNYLLRPAETPGCCRHKRQPPGYWGKETTHHPPAPLPKTKNTGSKPSKILQRPFPTAEQLLTKHDTKQRTNVWERMSNLEPSSSSRATQ